MASQQAASHLWGRLCHRGHAGAQALGRNGGGDGRQAMRWRQDEHESAGIAARLRPAGPRHLSPEQLLASSSCPGAGVSCASQVHLCAQAALCRAWHEARAWCRGTLRIGSAGAPCAGVHARGWARRSWLQPLVFTQKRAETASKTAKPRTGVGRARPRSWPLRTRRRRPTPRSSRAKPAAPVRGRSGPRNLTRLMNSGLDIIRPQKWADSPVPCVCVVQLYL